MLSKNRLIIGALCLVYVALRLWGIADSCLWFDEIFGVHAAEHSWSGMFGFVAEDLVHPPLFYVLLKLWMAVGGDGVFWLRLFPVIFSVLAIIPFLYLCRELNLKFLTIAAALGLFTVNGALIKYSQEVRMYSLLLFLSLMSVWLFARFFIKGKSFLALVIVNILLVYTHYFGWLVVGSEIVAILIFQRIKIKQMLLMFGLALVGYVPWIIAVYRAADSGSELTQNIGWIERPGIRSIFDFVFDVIEPFYFQASNAELTSLFYISIPLLILTGIVKVFFYANWKNFEDKNQFYLLAIFITVPIVLALVASWILPYSVWGSRHLIVVYAPIMILSAIFFTEIKQATIKKIGLFVIIFLVSIAFVLQLVKQPPEYVWCSWEKAAEKIVNAENIDSAEFTPVYTFEDLSAYHLWFALRKYERFRVFKVEGVKGISEDKAYFLPRGFDGVERINIDNVTKQRSFVVFRDSEMDRWRRPLRAFNYRNFELRMIEKFQTGKAKTFLFEVY